MSFPFAEKVLASQPPSNLNFRRRWSRLNLGSAGHFVPESVDNPFCKVKNFEKKKTERIQKKKRLFFCSDGIHQIKEFDVAFTEITFRDGSDIGFNCHEKRYQVFTYPYRPLKMCLCKYLKK